MLANQRKQLFPFRPKSKNKTSQDSRNPKKHLASRSASQCLPRKVCTHWPLTMSKMDLADEPGKQLHGQHLTYPGSHISSLYFPLPAGASQVQGRRSLHWRPVDLKAGIKDMLRQGSFQAQACHLPENGAIPPAGRDCPSSQKLCGSRITFFHLEFLHAGVDRCIREEPYA